MRLVKPSHEILFISPKPLETIEAAGRTCYKSENKITEGSAEKFVKMVIKRGHLSVIEHVVMSVRFICDRGVTYDLEMSNPYHNYIANGFVTHNSTRYCNYKGGVTFIIPPWLNLEAGTWKIVGGLVLPIGEDIGYNTAARKYDLLEIQNWLKILISCEQSYQYLLDKSWSPQQARSVLPNSLKTEIVMTANLREWMHVFKLRCSKAAHPQMRELMIPLLEEVKTLIPIIFDDVFKAQNELIIYSGVNWPGTEK